MAVQNSVRDQRKGKFAKLNSRLLLTGLLLNNRYNRFIDQPNRTRGGEQPELSGHCLCCRVGFTGLPLFQRCKSRQRAADCRVDWSQQTAVAAALDSLMTKELVQRSRHSHGARLYQLADAAIGDSRRLCLEELMALAVERQGRPANCQSLRKAAGGQRNAWERCFELENPFGLRGINDYK